VLSGNEEDAFRRIAEALGARIAEKAPPAFVPDLSPPPPSPPVPPAAPDTAVLDRLPVALVVHRDGETLYANRALLDLLGHADLGAFAAAGGIGALFPETAGGPEDGRVAVAGADGTRIAVEAHLHAVPWAGHTAMLLSLLRPGETGETAADAALGASEAAGLAERVRELETILDTATDGVVLIEGDGRIAGLNHTAEALFGIEGDDVAGAPFTDLLAEESRRAALDYIDGLAMNGVASVLNDGREVIGRASRGGLIPLFMTIGPLGDSGKYCAVLRDITHWKNVEEELVAARRAAEAANAQKSEFLAKISHEIRTPLNAIIGFSEVMMEERFGPIGSDRYRSYLKDIHVSGEHLMSLINDLLDLSKVEAGKLDLNFEAVSLNEAIRDAVALMQPQANRERVIIRTSLATGLPSVVADLRSLRQILLNLLSNAVKFTRSGGQVIVATSLEESGEVVIRIRDTGIGMTAGDLDTAMKPFRQVATSGRPREGTGLGLPLTKALVEANRASFAIDSVPSQGTLVRVTFPTTRVLAG
jgi:PAS domain S-box-containing protein